jgi:hypothetical protein
MYKNSKYHSNGNTINNSDNSVLPSINSPRGKAFCSDIAKIIKRAKVFSLMWNSEYWIDTNLSTCRWFTGWCVLQVSLWGVGWCDYWWITNWREATESRCALLWDNILTALSVAFSPQVNYTSRSTAVAGEGVPTFEWRGCCVVSTMGPHSR